MAKAVHDEPLSIAERNARSAALGRYTRFLMKRYQRVNFAEMADITDPIELRQVFVEMRISPEDIPEETLGQGIAQIEDEPPPGEDAWKVLAREPFVALSGRPGSGKSTLVQGVIAQLCGDPPGRLCKLLPAVPVPFILREIPGIASAKTVDEVFDLWWPSQVEQAEKDGFPLDLARLRAVLGSPASRGRDVPPVLLLFDGIDEIGGAETRQGLFDLAHSAHEAGYRVLVTGRPSGYRDLFDPTLREARLRDGYEPPTAANNVLALHHLAPFAGRQVLEYLDRWYALRGEWERKKQEGIARFRAHVADKARPQLLSLARRPIFLTLMAVVHTTQNELPEGRALLYKAILDLYLGRQERHRQLKETQHGQPMPHWPQAETRLVLGHLAWQSQLRGSEAEEKAPKARQRGVEMRRVVWTRREVEATFHHQIATGNLGRFATLTPDDASELLHYFLHPAGLLVEPAEGFVQFAHLSFQEYLCAWFLHERSKVDEVRSQEEYLRDQLFAHLRRPGWEEVGILHLCIVADETGNQGHFRVLRWLDLGNREQAVLFVQAVCGQELPFTESERLSQLPTVVACALAYPGILQGLGVRKTAAWLGRLREMVLAITASADSQAAWEVIKSGSTHPYIQTLGERWIATEIEMNRDVKLGADEGRAHSLLDLINDSGLADERNECEPLNDPQLEAAIVRWLRGNCEKIPGPFFWKRDSGGIPSPAKARLMLDVLLPSSGDLWRLGVGDVPLDAWLLQGVLVSAERSADFVVSQPAILLSLYPSEPLPARTKVALTLYQALVALEGVAEGRLFHEWLEKRSEMQGLPLGWWVAGYDFGSLMQSQLRSRLLSRPMARLGSRSLALFLSRKVVVVDPEARSISISSGVSQEHFRLMSSRVSSLRLREDGRERLCSYLNRIESLSPEAYGKADLSSIDLLASYGLKAAAFEWFESQAELPGLLERRGLPPGTPIPRQFPILDERGLLLSKQRRESWVALRTWLDDDAEILEFVFPKGEGLTAADKKALRADLAILRQQPWSPQAGIDAMLKAWPAREPVRDIALQTAERKLNEALDRALPELKRSPKKEKQPK